MAPAYKTVGQFYDLGDGVKPDPNAALYWYGRAYRHGDFSAANNIGCIWRERGNVGRALTWFRRAVKLGDPEANLNIAKIYVDQRRNPKKALGYLHRVRRAKGVTEGSREETKRLLKKLGSSGEEKDPRA